MSGAGLKVLAVSDVAFGYGSPQILQLLSSLMDRFDVARCAAVEPDQKNRPSRPLADGRIEVRRIITTMPAYDETFVPEFARRTAEFVDAFQPDIIIATHSFALPAVLMQARRPSVFIYYMLESIEHQIHGMGPMAVELNRHALADADLVLAPERRRAQADLYSYGWQRSDMIEVLNVAPKQARRATPVRDRLRRVLHAGSLGAQTMTDLMLSDSVSDIDFDIAGSADNAAGYAFLEAAAKRPNIRYLGMLPNDKLWEIRPHYAFSTAIWRPDNINQLFASPNKFFESIAAGTPVIAGPHPQCADILAKHQCGLVMMDWAAGPFSWVLRHGLAKFAEALASDAPEGSEYGRMVSNCLAASAAELNWEYQVEPALERIAAILPSAASGKSRRWS